MSLDDVPRERGSYVRFTDFRTRWADNDQFGHLNNALYYGLFDSAVNLALTEETGFDPLADPEVFYVVESGCRYHAALAYPGVVEVGVRVTRLGGSSVTYDVAVFGPDEQLAAATGRFVHVHVDRRTGRPAPLAGERRAALARAYGVEP
ncbi:acyl-CoA thioesterase [Phycicoccus sp. CSK15P-2]|uniref:acyl-CoA thioesterase n=1 Tax=Phycicoccus sp. CSK15P-2 TaxID=2807627 RepID=UPI00194FECEB|nr:thioesterase family protein [Phycicoccus sp. CSK15P-2]MBM6404888.1 acyl-CoA thioesterase [Phycicoccus sp. CSK15P-2]